MVALNWGERSVHCFSSSMALSKFLTYSAYIFKKGVSFWRMSPRRGVDSLKRSEQETIKPNTRHRLSYSNCGLSGCVYYEPTHSNMLINSLSLNKGSSWATARFLTILPCVSPGLAGGTGCGRHEWRRY